MFNNVSLETILPLCWLIFLQIIWKFHLLPHSLRYTITALIKPNVHSVSYQGHCHRVPSVMNESWFRMVKCWTIVTYSKLELFHWSSTVGHFFPDFLMPPDASGPLPEALAASSFNFFCSSCCFFLNSISDSSRTFSSFLADLSGFFLPPSRPDILTSHKLT